MLLDTAQKHMVRVTRRGRESVYVMSPEVLEDYLDGFLAMETEKNGMLSYESSEKFLNQFKNA